MRDPYHVLNVPRDADLRTIRRAYKRLAVQFHPDQNPDPEATERFKEVAAAYAILTEPRERVRFERQRQRHAQEQYHQAREHHARRSDAARAAEEAFWQYARERAAARAEPEMATPSWPEHLGGLAAILLVLCYLWRCLHLLPLQPWLWAGSFRPHPLDSMIWVTIICGMLMIAAPRWFYVPFVMDERREVQTVGWFFVVAIPLADTIIRTTLGLA